MRVDRELVIAVERSAARQGLEQVASLGERSPDTGATCRELDGAALLWSGPGRYLNRAVGLGSGALQPGDLLDEVEAFYAGHDAPAMFELCPWHDGLVEEVARRGYAVRWFRNVYARELGDVHDRPTPPHHFLVQRVDAEHYDTWCDILGGELAPGSPERAISAEFCDAVHHHGDASRRGYGHGNIDLVAIDPDTGEAVACGSLHAVEGIGWLGGAATLTAHRGRGAQSELIVDRLHRAGRAGCRLAAATALPGRTSARNLAAHGFQLLYTQAVVARP